MDIKRGMEVQDIKREIKGIVVNIVKDEFHVEYKRFKGDTEPYYISYPLDTKEIEIVYSPDIEESKYIISKDYLTVGKLKQMLDDCKLSDNSPVMVEMVSPDTNWNHKHVICEGSADEATIVQAWCASHHKEEKYLLIWLNY